ncbi:MAG TPA: hypothetical protein VLE93_02360 [Candidatus Saccharimonadales bacterium]|nr:hypothetical protein [Candidatus Saccharimonadales bacterium]
MLNFVLILIVCQLALAIYSFLEGKWGKKNSSKLLLAGVTTMTTYLSFLLLAPLLKDNLSPYLVGSSISLFVCLLSYYWGLVSSRNNAA